jgi:ABC-2 type transport system permease protein
VLAGTWFPVTLLPGFLLRLAWFDPIFHMNEAFKGVAGRGLGWSELATSLGFLAVFAVLSLALGATSYRRMLTEEKHS